MIQPDVERRMVCGEEDLRKKEEEIKKLNHQLRILGNTVGDPASVEKFKKRSADLHEEVQAQKAAMAALKKKYDDLKILFDLGHHSRQRAGSC